MERRALLRALTAGGAVAASVLAGRRLVGPSAPEARLGTAPAAPVGAAEPLAPEGSASRRAVASAPSAAEGTEAVPGDAVGGPDDPTARADDAAELAEDPTAPAAEVVVLPAVAVLCREATGLVAPRDGGRDHRIETLTLHHSAVRHDRVSEGPRRMRGHQRHHQGQGWIDVAYHYGVDLGGNVYELRDVGLAGDTFTDYDPSGHFLVVCEGDYDQQRPTDAMLAAVAGLFAHAAVRYGVPTSTIAGHRDHASTRCPGRALVEALPSLRDEAGRLAGLGAPELVRACGSEGAARVAAIEAA
ncbi:MAG: hypothetical protein RLZZ272_46 [Actinomycetota bacterium]